jgi:hypothetical protein
MTASRRFAQEGKGALPASCPVPPRVYDAHGRCAGQPWRGRCRARQAFARLLRRALPRGRQKIASAVVRLWVAGRRSGRGHVAPGRAFFHPPPRPPDCLKALLRSRSTQGGENWRTRSRTGRISSTRRLVASAIGASSLNSASSDRNDPSNSSSCLARAALSVCSSTTGAMALSEPGRMTKYRRCRSSITPHACLVCPQTK